MKNLAAISLVAASCIIGCSEKGPPPPVEFPDTPEGIVLKLEEALRNRDANAAAACRAFDYEGELEYRAAVAKAKEAKEKGTPEVTRDEAGNNISVPSVEDNPAAAKTFAGMRDFIYRANFQNKGFPNLIGVSSTVTDQETGEDGIVSLTLVRKHPDGKTTSEPLKTVKTPAGWRVFESPE